MNNSQLTNGLAMGAFCVGAGCLVVSLVQASGMILKHVPDAQVKWVIVLGIGCALMASQVLVRMFIPLIRSEKSWVWAVAIMALCACVFVIELFSISTSTATFDGSLIDARRNQNIESKEHKELGFEVTRLNSQIRKLEAERNRMPDDWATRKADVESRIDKLYTRKEGMRSEQKNLDVSTSGKAFDNLENRTGFSQTDVALLFALLMTVVPLTVNLVAGALRSSEVQTRKKRKAPNLKSVPVGKAHAI